MHRDYIVIGEGKTLPLRTQLECTHFWKTYSKPNTYAYTEREREPLFLYLWLISDSGYTNIINQAD